MEKSFPEFYDYYLSVIGDNSHLNGQNMQVGTLNVICKYILLWIHQIAITLSLKNATSQKK